MLAILYDRIRGDEKLLFEAADRLGLAWKKVYLPRLVMDLENRPDELAGVGAALEEGSVLDYFKKHGDFPGVE